MRKQCTGSGAEVLYLNFEIYIYCKIIKVKFCCFYQIFIDSYPEIPLFLLTHMHSLGCKQDPVCVPKSVAQLPQSANK